jgi:uncharacterized protein YfdQ (DUF2303 family)
MAKMPDLGPENERRNGKGGGELISTSDTERRDAQAILDAAREFADPVPLELKEDGVPYVIALPDGRRLASVKSFVDEWRTKPERREGIAQLSTLEAFIAHARRFKDESSAIFLDDLNPKSPRFITVIDYHREGPEGEPRFMRHRGVYDFPLSDEWRAWWNNSNKALSQEAFAEFLEDHLTDIQPLDSAGEILNTFAANYGVPLGSPAALLEVSKGLSINVDQAVNQHINLSTGETVVSFEEKHKGKGGSDVKVPKAFGISIPVFREGARYQIPVRLRYKVAGGKISFTFMLHRPDMFFEHALIGAIAKVAEDTQLPVYRGRPEASS